MSKEFRRQLTLFIKSRDAVLIEQIRKEYNPKQFELIKSHVTLCREDEIENIDLVLFNLSRLKIKEIQIEFDKLVRFDNDKGLMLHAKECIAFEELRHQILKGIIKEPRKQEPHITLMHPRNSLCTDDIYDKINNLNLTQKLIFDTISLIEQKNIGKWELREEFKLEKDDNILHS